MILLKVVGFLLFTLSIDSALSSSSKLLVVRGSGKGQRMELVDLDNQNESKELAPFPYASMAGQGFVLDDSTVLMCGGIRVPKYECTNTPCFQYNFKNNSWTKAENQPEDLVQNGPFVNVPNVGPMILDGLTDGFKDFNGKCNYKYALGRSQILSGKEWRYGPNCFASLQYGCAVQINPSLTWVITWSEASFGDSEVYIYDWTNGDISNKLRIPDGKKNLRFTACGMDPKSGKIVLAGGSGGDWIAYPTDKVYLYDYLTNTWTDGPKLPYTVVGGVLTTVDDRLILSGGNNANNDKLLHEYSTKDGWKKLNVTLKYGRSFHNALAIPKSFL